MNPKRKRHLLKALSWRLFAFIVLGVVTLLVTGSWTSTGWVALVYNLLQIPTFYFHESIWERKRND